MNLQIKEYLITEFEKLSQSNQETIIDFIDFLNSRENIIDSLELNSDVKKVIK